MFSLLALYLSYRRDRAAADRAPAAEVVPMALAQRFARIELPLAA